ncbi:hypothetical protein [Streptomyces sp. NPDC101150]|uniref:hypothetical protein n=1 Tax=Streptomyces sp. NPDC101150 TaxID=3366114 RepID=UPI00382ECB73
MKASRIRRRLAGAATVAALVGAGTLAAAPTAAAKANLLAINKVSLAKPGLQVKLTYSCDTGVDLQIAGYASKVTKSVPGQRNAAGAIKAGTLTCDYASRTVQLKLNPVDKGFAKGDKVKVTVFYFDDNGLFHANEEATAVL